ncbi:hypothetical protein BHE74_00033066 [Ensete ventricosum]|nr:hypothetical protein BHE74_00033066 [Ensete ventricosum]
MQVGWCRPHERILALRVANKELKLGANQDLVAVIEFRMKGLEEDVKKLWTELESIKNQRRGLEGGVRVLHSSLDEAQDDRARLEGDVLSLTEATTLLEVELKAKGPKRWSATRRPEDSSRALRRWGRSAMSSGTGWRLTAVGKASGDRDRARPVRRMSKGCQCGDGSQPAFDDSTLSEK